MKRRFIVLALLLLGLLPITTAQPVPWSKTSYITGWISGGEVVHTRASSFDEFELDDNPYVIPPGQEVVPIIGDPCSLDSGSMWNVQVSMTGSGALDRLLVFSEAGEQVAELTADEPMSSFTAASHDNCLPNLRLEATAASILVWEERRSCETANCVLQLSTVDIPSE